MKTLGFFEPSNSRNFSYYKQKLTKKLKTGNFDVFNFFGSFLGSSKKIQYIPYKTEFTSVEFYEVKHLSFGYKFGTRQVLEKKNAAHLNIFLSLMKYGRKIKSRRVKENFSKRDQRVDPTWYIQLGSSGENVKQIYLPASDAL